MLLVMTVSLVILTGCKSDDDGGSGGSAAAGTVEATVNGSNFTSMEIASWAQSTTTNGITQLAISGSDANGNVILIQILGYEGVGTYEFDSNSTILNTASYTEVDISDISNPVSSSWIAPFMDSGVAGTVNISSDDGTTYEGTFEFEAKGQDGNPTDTQGMINVTNGSFNVDILN